VVAKKKHLQTKAIGHHVKNAKSLAASQASFRQASMNHKVQSKFLSPGQVYGGNNVATIDEYKKQEFTDRAYQYRKA